jgi:hypothetical protein
MYCGRKLQIKGTQTYGRGRCPSCRHIIFIPKEEVGQEPSLAATLKDKIDFSKMSNEKVEELLDLRPRGDIWKLLDNCRTFLPSYDEITLFTLSFSLVVLYFMNEKFRLDIHKSLFIQQDGRAILVALYSVVGMFFSLFNLFRKQIDDDEKYFMLLFAVVITACTGFYSSYVIWDQFKGWLMIFPIWNITNGVLMLVLLQMGVLDTDCILENDTNFWQVFVSIIAVGIILGLCNYIFKMHWIISYSICVCYTITINDAIHSLAGINRYTPQINQDAN